jgi:hypothetical protein
MANILRLPCSLTTPGACNATELAAVDDYRVSMLGALAPLFTPRSPNGAFLSTCVQHCHQNVRSWQNEFVDGVELQTAFLAWWDGAPGSHVLVDGPLGSNKRCA